jgi:hypothetical protein
MLCTSKQNHTPYSLKTSTCRRYPRKESPLVLESDETNIRVHSTRTKSQDLHCKRTLHRGSTRSRERILFEMHRSREPVYIIFNVRLNKVQLLSYATTGNLAKDTFTNARVVSFRTDSFKLILADISYFVREYKFMAELLSCSRPRQSNSTEQSVCEADSSSDCQ